MSREPSMFKEQFDDWLVGEGQRQKSIPSLLDSYCRFLAARGYGVKRCNLAADTVHPQMKTTRHVWFSEAADPGPINPAVLVRRRQYRMGDAMIDEAFLNAANQANPQFVASPFHRVATEGELYAVISPSGAEQMFPVFHDLAAIGCTAYFAMRLDGFAGVLQRIGLAVDNEGGLSPEEVNGLRWSLRLFTLLLNTLIEYNIKNTLAEMYIGHDPGRRVCSGMIELGSVVATEGAIWFSDIRGFASLSDDLPAGELIAALNDYYRVVVGAIYAHGGEVLKYIGDAVLAIFPVTGFTDASAACLAAYETAREARLLLVELNDRRRSSGQEPVNDGIALHFGVAQYGNIGSDERLDFTLIGREVNLASRVMGLAKTVSEQVICTKAFRDACGIDMRFVGSFEVRGLRDPVDVFAP